MNDRPPSTPSTEEHRQHPRFRLALPVTVALPSGDVTATTVGVSRSGLSLRMSTLPALDEVLRIRIQLPNGHVVEGRGRCRGHMPGPLCGLSLELDGKNQVIWDSFVDEEETSGSFWRMIGRMARAGDDDAYAARGVVDVDHGSSLRFHTAGENGVAYRIAFSRLPSDPAEESDLCVKLPGFREPARRHVRRVLREDMCFRMDEAGRGPLVTARVVELNRGGFAYVQGDDLQPVGLVSLAVGELLLVEKNGASVFPHFSPLELEQIACDTFRHDLQRPLFRSTSTVPSPVSLPPLPSAPPAPRQDPKRFQVGYDAVRFAQAAASDVQMRRYGDRDIYFHPSVWAKVKDQDVEMMGPTLQDGGRVCVLALVGPGAPRVVRLDENSQVALLKPPAK